MLQNYLCFLVMFLLFLPSPPVAYPRVQHLLPRQVEEWAGMDFFFLIQAIHSPMSGINKRLCSVHWYFKKPLRTE